MGRYSLTNKAVQDLSSIWEYTVDTWLERQADKYYFMLLNSCQDIADGKVIGKVEIARILHAQMDLKNRIQE